MPQRQCNATTKAGHRCRAPALPDDDQCFTHAPAAAAARAERNRRGGRNKDGAMRAAKTWTAVGRDMQTEDLPALLLGMAEAVATGDLQPAQASAIAQLIKTALNVDAHIRWERRFANLEATLTRLDETLPKVPRSPIRRG